MFKQETIRNYVTKMQDAIHTYMVSNEAIKVSISKGNSKIGKVMNVSLPAIFTCGHCKECKGYCYDIRDCRYSNVVNARARNYAAITKDLNNYFEQIWAAMSRRRKNKYFRFHVGGDIPSMMYFEYMIETARKYPDWIIWTYTKEYAIVNEWIRHNGSLPSNLTIMFSEWRGLPMVNPYGMPEFRVIFKGENVPSDCTWICPGCCDICKLGQKRGCVAGETTHAHEH